MENIFNDGDKNEITARAASADAAPRQTSATQLSNHTQTKSA